MSFTTPVPPVPPRLDEFVVGERVYFNSPNDHLQMCFVKRIKQNDAGANLYDIEHGSGTEINVTADKIYRKLGEPRPGDRVRRRPNHGGGCHGTFNGLSGPDAGSVTLDSGGTTQVTYCALEVDPDPAPAARPKHSLAPHARVIIPASSGIVDKIEGDEATVIIKLKVSDLHLLP